MSLKTLLVPLCVVTLAAKLPLLFTSQRMADGDEAIVGLMGLHILTQHQHPLFTYGQNYDAGAGVMAHLAALLFSIAGVSSISLKAAALLVWGALVVAVVSVLWRRVGPRAALYGAALTGFSPASVEWSLKVRGGHTLAALAVVVLLDLGLSLISEDAKGRKYGVSRLVAAFGACATLAVWLHPSAAPFVGAAGLGVLVVLLRRRHTRAVMLLLVSGVIGVATLLVPLGQETYWNWQSLRGAGIPTPPARLLVKVLTGLFTPNLDWSIPPAPVWVDAVGWLWLTTWFGATVLVLRGSLRTSTQEGGTFQPGFLFVAVSCAGVGTMLLISPVYLSPYALLPLYPLSCIGIAAALHFMGDTPVGGRIATALATTLALSGVLVHVSSLGPATIHGAAEQNRRIPAAVVTEILADLGRHQVRHVFSQSPMLHWNLMFESREGVLARWRNARDRWQPYVDAVNLAYRERLPVALLLMLNGDEARIARLQREYAAKPGKLTMIGSTCALVYDAPARVIQSQFAGARASVPAR